MSETEGKLKRRFAERFDINKKKLILSLLAAFAAPFLILIYSSFTVFFNNSDELVFSFKDFALTYIIGFILAFALFFSILLLTRKRIHFILFSLFSGVAVCAYIQSLITTTTFKGLPGDGMASAPSLSKTIFNLSLWIVALATFVFFGAFFKKAAHARVIISFLLILITVMQVFSVIPSAISFASKPNDKFEKEKIYFLSNENKLELSSDENIVVFVLDSFDREMFIEYLDSDPNAPEDFDGFTYYDDNIASYPRTFPAVTSMLTGVHNDFSLNRKEYFSSAYGDAQFLDDLKANGYKINLYIPLYYGYDNADVLLEYADNTSVAEGYEITNPKKLSYRMFSLSSYFWLPEIIKSKIISTSSFQELGAYISDDTMHNIDNSHDPEFYNQLLTQKLSADEEQKVFTFLHIRGCHPPFAMNEDCEQVRANSVSSLQQTTGSFKILKEYIRQMKELGIYENSTIIITGDHAGDDGWENVSGYSHAMNTALLVKEKGAAGTKLVTSNAPVSQDNLQAEIVKSAGLTTSHDYGKAYSDIVENDETVIRTHYFLRYTRSARRDEVVTYEIKGDGRKFENWKEVSRQDVGSIYD